MSGFSNEVKVPNHHKGERFQPAVFRQDNGLYEGVLFDIESKQAAECSFNHAHPDDAYWAAAGLIPKARGSS